MGLPGGLRLTVICALAALLAACADPSSEAGQTLGSAHRESARALPLVRTGNILHPGTYCRGLQQASPGNNTLPVANGCLFNLTTPVDLFAPDAGTYSVSEVVGQAQLGVRGPADARVMIVCRLSPRAQFWFWISADGHWNISRVDDVHHPQDLVAGQQSDPLRQYVKTGGQLNELQFKCEGEPASREITLAANVNGHQFAALSVPMPEAGTPLSRPSTPWFVDVGARLTAEGTLEGTVARVTLYGHE